VLLLEVLEDRLAPALLTVNTLADETTADNYLSLREAVGVVNSGSTSGLSSAELAQVSGALGSNDTIQFSLPSGPQTLTLTGSALNLTHSVTITGPGASSLTLSGNNTDRVFLVGQIFSQNLSLVVSLSGLTVADGNVVSSSSNYGGGLLNFGTLTVNNCTISSNAAGSTGGGGIYNVGALTLNGCTFTNNTAAGNGGGLNTTSAGTLSVTNCTFTGNTTTGSYSYGGGLINSSTSTTTPGVVSNCTFSNNSSTGSGAGLFHDTGAAQLTVHNCTFSGNRSSADGGGLDDDGNLLTVTDCTFTGNTSANDGGGLQNWKGTLSLRNSTFTGNTAAYGGGLTIAGPATVVNCTITANRVTGTSGGGLYNYNATATGQVFNTVVAGNYQGASGTTPNDITGTLDSSSAFNLIGTGGSGGLQNGVNGNQVGVSNPGLGPLADNGGPTQTVALLPGSPAIDHGGNAYVNAGETDQRGFTRIVNGTADIGAFEVQAASNGQPPAITSASANPNPVTGTTTQLTVTATDPNGGSLTYIWSLVSGPTGVTFDSNNGTTSGNSVTATFSMAGSYTFQVTVTDSLGLSSTQNVTVTVQQTLTSIAVAPATASIKVGGKVRFTATALDQFGNPLAVQPGFAWTVVSGPGTISSSGLYTGPATGTAVIEATVTGTTISSSATVTVKKR
jgi:hypothetical protein